MHTNKLWAIGCSRCGMRVQIGFLWEVTEEEARAPLIRFAKQEGWWYSETQKQALCRECFKVSGKRPKRASPPRRRQRRRLP